MRFLFRAAFWLLVMSTIVPSGNNAAASLDHAIGAAAESAAAVGSKLGTWCGGTAEDCAILTKYGLAALRTVKVPDMAMPDPAPPTVPLPAARPAALAARG
jgi:hypothetical protein